MSSLDQRSTLIFSSLWNRPSFFFLVAWFVHPMLAASPPFAAAGLSSRPWLAPVLVGAAASLPYMSGLCEGSPSSRPLLMPLPCASSHHAPLVAARCTGGTAVLLRGGRAAVPEAPSTPDHCWTASPLT
ncbi:hypothetical protein AAHA92_24765 [Salvia divinorum]|uniref:Uncharacterized protein n=1 Tax=Salvia divinorum TaxID=28513 RepID=A0ABD1G8F4_SALDI